MRATLAPELDTVRDDGARRLLELWREIDWFVPGTRTGAVEAARHFAEHQSAAHAFAPDLFARAVEIDVRISTWTELGALCRQVRSDDAYDWKYSALKPLVARHSRARGWSLSVAPPEPFFVRVHDHVMWRVMTALELAALPGGARDAAAWYEGYAVNDLTYAIQWELAEPGGRNPLVPLLRCYAAGFLPFVVGRGHVVLWSVG